MMFFGLHGFLGSPEDYSHFTLMDYNAKFIPDLALKNYPFTYDQPLKKWSSEFNNFVKSEYPNTKRVLCGYSMGGRLALHAALDDIDLWDELIFLSTNPGFLTVDEKVKRQKNDNLWTQKYLNLSSQEFLNEWNAQNVFEADPPLLGFSESYKPSLLNNISPVENMLTNWSLGHHEISSEDIFKLNLKAHWYCGACDLKFVNIYRSLAEKNSEFNYSIVLNEGHRILQNFSL